MQPQGPFAQIDTRLANETLEVLEKGNAKEQQRAIERIRAGPQNFAPPVLYALANVLFERGEKDDAAFWFYAGQLRARFDANRCADLHGMEAMRSALGGKSGAVTALSAPAEEWENIAEKTREDYLDGFKKAVARVKSRQK